MVTHVTRIEPGVHRAQRAKLRIMSPAPPSSISETAISPATSRLRKGVRASRELPRPPCFERGLQIGTRELKRRRQTEQNAGHARSRT